MAFLCTTCGGGVISAKVCVTIRRKHYYHTSLYEYVEQESVVVQVLLPLSCERLLYVWVHELHGRRATYEHSYPLVEGGIASKPCAEPRRSVETPR